MKRVIMYALIGGAVFYAHARISFAEPKVMSWLMSHSTRAMSGDTTACDDYTDDVEVVLTASGRSGRWEVEGGKNELCGYLRQAAAAFTVLQARVDTRYEDIEITPASFPWMDASVSYTQITDVRVGGLPPVTIETVDTLTVRRGLAGLKISAVESESTGGL